jgi:4'-phosphopantetheinyl transferase
VEHIESSASVRATSPGLTSESSFTPTVSTGVACLGPREAHVWHIPLLALADRTGRLGALLSPAECSAALRLRFERDRVRFVCRRGAVRLILSGYLGVAPDRLQFRTNVHGKPELEGLAGQTGIRFNVSHSSDLALCAVTFGRRIGIDVEKVRAVADAEFIARLAFSPSEQDTLSALPVDDRQLSFLRCWTRKEAFVKACGAGLSFPLQCFDVSLRPEEPAALLRIGRDTAAGQYWSMRSFEPPGGYVAAAVIAGSGYQVSSWQCFEGLA